MDRGLLKVEVPILKAWQAGMAVTRQPEPLPAHGPVQMLAQDQWLLAATALRPGPLPLAPPLPKAERAPANRLSADCKAALAAAASACSAEPGKLKQVYDQLVSAAELAHAQESSFPLPPMPPAGAGVGERRSKKAAGGRQGPPETAGSIGHNEGLCKPCVFWHKGVCFKKSDCTFCHLQHDAERIRHVRPSKSTRQCLQRRDEQRKIDLERRRLKRSLAAGAAAAAAAVDVAMGAAVAPLALATEAAAMEEC